MSSSVTSPPPSLSHFFLRLKRRVECDSECPSSSSQCNYSIRRSEPFVVNTMSSRVDTVQPQLTTNYSLFDLRLYCAIAGIELIGNFKNLSEINTCYTPRARPQESCLTLTYLVVTTGRCTWGCVEEGLRGQGGGEAGAQGPLRHSCGGLAEALRSGEVTASLSD